MASPSDLNLEYKPDINQMIQKPVGEHPDSQKRIKEFLARLEEERLKIEAFKRELPLCMQLLNNAMETYAQQLEEYQSSQGPKPVLEEFIPLRQTSIEGSSDAAASEKASWMVSAQLALWSQTPKDCEPKLALDSKQRNGGAFLPFSKEKNQCAASTASGGLPELALASSEKDSREKSNIESGSKGGEVGGGKGGGSKSEGQAANQTQRKARRCWSPDLHRRFVDALQMLGGSQAVATPKQIRELMKVDGLTNDEVKSHLQKYRLHTRRPISGPQPTAMAAGPPHLVVLGGIWVPPEYATSASAGAAPAIYGAHPYGPHHHFYPALHRNGSHKGRIGSPESEMRSGGERSEIVEEEEEEEREEEDEEKAEEKAKAEMGNGGEVSINL
ncbi:myb family transcription factor EFM-like isoform X3 [Typha latifolia]|uniref:myb family transcription factor EFM-like isoform X3 n=1 Tax=Typha latifolia TaxID=4733 RepID=UPI003C2CAA11